MWQTNNPNRNKENKARYRENVVVKDNGLLRKYRIVKDRCSNVLAKNYGGRGIKCLWKSYAEFKNDMYDSYLKHLSIYGKLNTTIDRIDSNGHYCKENCRWATPKQQSLNKRNTIFVNYKNKLVTLVELCNNLNLNYPLMYHRYVRAKWPIEKVVESAIDIKKSNKKIKNHQLL